MGRRKIEDPLEGGLPSRIYIAAYPKFKSAYDVAKLIIPRGEARNSAGRILSIASQFPEYFETKITWIGKFKPKTLILSKAEPFLDRLVRECGIEEGELEPLKAFIESRFRRVMGIYLALTLKRDQGYLAGELSAFEELTNALCLTLYLARFYSKVSTRAREMGFSLASKALRHVLEASNVTDEEWINIAGEVNNMIEQPSLAGLYEKIREATSPQYRPILTLLEGFERLSESLKMESQTLSRIIKELESKARKE